MEDVLYHDNRGITDYHDTLAKHAFGNFRDLLEDVTPAPDDGGISQYDS